MITTDPRRAAVIYTRISLDRDGTRANVRTQEQDSREIVEDLGLDLVEIYEDNDRSATHGRRPGYQEMLTDLALDDGPLWVIAYAADRLLRSSAEAEKLVQIGQRRGITVSTVRHGDFDFSKAAGRENFRTAAARAQGEVEQMGERLKRKHRRLRDEGRYALGGPQFGWQYNANGGRDGPDGRAFDLHPVHAEMIRKGIENALAGVSLREIARQWTELGANGRPHSRRGGDWNATQVKQTLQRWRNAGWIEYEGEPVRVSRDWEPIPGITLDHVKAIRQKMAERKVGPRSGGRAPQHLLSGLVFCQCGRPMESARKGARQRGTYTFNYRCSIYRNPSRVVWQATGGPSGHSTRAEQPLESHVLTILAERLSCDKEILLELLAAPSRTGGNVGALRQEAEALRLRIANIAARWGRLEIDDDAYDAATRAATARRAEIVKTLTSATRRSPTATLIQEAADQGRGAGEVFLAADLGRQRAVIGELCEVRLLPAKGKGIAVRGRPGQRFDPSRVVIAWKVEGYRPEGDATITAA